MDEEPGRKRGRGPGRVWTAAFRLLLPEGQREAALGDAAEEHALLTVRDGPAAADRWYRGQVLRSIGPAIRHGATAIRHGAGAVRDRWSSTRGEEETMTMWRQDLTLAVRVLLKRPGFTGVVVATLALGIGVTTALFGVFRGVFLEPLPLPESGELVVVMEQGTFGCCGPASGPDYVDWAERQRSFEGMAMLDPLNVTLTGLEEPERVYATRVTPNAFGFLGVEPALGRALTEEDQVAGDVAVLSHETWLRVFDGRTDALGASLEIDGAPRTVVGVMPEDFDVPSPWLGTRHHQLYLPMPPERLQGSRGSHSYPVIARLSDGVTLESAQGDMDRIMRELAAEYPDTNADRSAKVFTVHEYLYGSVGDQLLLILAAAGLVLLIACANVGGLQLARAVGRESELSVRAALGASRRAMMRLLFSESLILALVGGALGVGVAYVALDGLKMLLPPSIPRIDEVTMDPAALAFALGASVLTAILFGMIPALFASRTDLAAGVKEGGRGTLAAGKERIRDLFIVGQIALGLVLANGAGLLVRSYTEVRSQEYGFETEGVVTMALNPQGPRYGDAAARERYLEAVAEEVGRVGGVRSVGMVSRLPLAGGSNGNVQVEGWEPRSNRDRGPLVEVTSVVGDYFEAMGIPLLQGRTLVADDSISDAVGVVINKAMADEVWPGESPLGKRFGFGTPPPWLTVVGVVGNVRQWGPEQDVLAQAYLPYARGWSSSGYLTVRITGAPSTLVPELRRAVLAVDPTQPPADVRGMDERLEGTLAQRRFYTTLIALFAVSALFLASAGVYGTVSYFVARRTREVGIRMALGAAGGGILRMIVRRGGRLALAGIAIGLVGVWATVSIAESLVYGVAAVDPVSLGVGCAVLAGVAVGASVLPALRALRIHPSVALRTE